MHSDFHGACRYGWRRYLHVPDWGSKRGNCSQMIPIICELNHARISWVSIEIYYHDNFVFGHIFMFLTSFYAHSFCLMCSTGQPTVRGLEIHELWYVASMLANASVLYLTIWRITWSLWRGTRGLTKLGLKLMS